MVYIVKNLVPMHQEKEIKIKITCAETVGGKRQISAASKLLTSAMPVSVLPDMQLAAESIDDGSAERGIICPTQHLKFCNRYHTVTTFI